MKIDPQKQAAQLYNRIKGTIEDLSNDDAAAVLDELLLVIDEERDKIEDRLTEEDEDTE